MSGTGGSAGGAMDKAAVRTEGAPGAIGPYSQGIVAGLGAGAGGLVFVSGQIGADPGGTVADGVEAQARRALQNVAAVLEAAGSSMAQVVKTTVFLKDMGQFAAMNAVYAQFFPDPAPARSTVEVARLPRDVLVEVEAIALAASGSAGPQSLTETLSGALPGDR